MISGRVRSRLVRRPGKPIAQVTRDLPVNEAPWVAGLTATSARRGRR